MVDVDNRAILQAEIMREKNQQTVSARPVIA